MAPWVKDPAVSLLSLGSLLWLGFHPLALEIPHAVCVAKTSRKIK